MTAARRANVRTGEADLPRLVEDVVAEQWQDILEIETIGWWEDFFELGGDSLQLVRILERIRQIYECEVDLSTFLASPTIETMGASVRQAASANDASTLIRLTRSHDGAGAAFVLVPGVQGRVVPYLLLARRLDGYRVYAAQPRGFAPEEEPWQDVASMANAYNAAIRAQVRERELVLAGYSSGGVVCFEMARRLLLNDPNARVSVVLLDTMIDRSGLASLVDEVRLERADLASGVWERNLDRLIDELVQRRRMPPYLQGLGRATQRRWLRVRAVTAAALEEYVPHRVEVATRLVRSTEFAALCPHDPTLGWGAFADVVEIADVEAQHGTLLRTPASDSVADLLNRWYEPLRTPCPRR